MKKTNCWEFMKCGREPGGFNTETLGVCPISNETSADGMNGGMNGGRLCWIVAEQNNGRHTCCRKSASNDPCFSCEFRFKVTMEEGLVNVCKATGSYLNMQKEILESHRLQSEQQKLAGHRLN